MCKYIQRLHLLAPNWNYSARFISRGIFEESFLHQMFHLSFALRSIFEISRHWDIFKSALRDFPFYCVDRGRLPAKLCNCINTHCHIHLLIFTEWLICSGRYIAAFCRDMALSHPCLLIYFLSPGGWLRESNLTFPDLLKGFSFWWYHWIHQRGCGISQSVI